MQTTVVIATKGRPEVVRRLLLRLQDQTTKPDLTIVVGSNHSDMPPTSGLNIPVILLLSAPGLTLQRNAGLEHIFKEGIGGVVVFFDDDFIPARDWLALAARTFAHAPQVKGLTGLVLADGAGRGGIPYEEGERIVEAAMTAHTVSVAPVRSLYGCNMAFRLDAVGTERFDERLKRYGWQEDLDFSRRIGNHYQCVALSGVHLGVPGGRVSGTVFGIAQVINPVYLLQKGTMPWYWGLRLVVGNTGANIAGSVLGPEQGLRRERLRGNMSAWASILRGSCDPEMVERLS